jgi:Tol biopolymer transport system component/DNA-binding winged helix-turn-helix (wHTH) protein
MPISEVNPGGSSRKGVIGFGVFEADLDSGELRRGGLRLRLQDKPFQILTVLLQRPGEAVTREELRQQLWGSDTYVDFDRSLNIAVAKLRAALCDDADIPRYVETLPRRGYRFIGQINSDGDVSAAQPISNPSRKRSWRAMRILLAAASAMLAVALLRGWQFHTMPELRVLGITQITNDGFPKTAESALDGFAGTALNGSTLYFGEVLNDGPTLARVSTSGGTVESLRTPLKDPLVEGFSAARSELLAIDLVGHDGGPLWALKMPGADAREVGTIVASAAAWAPDGETITYAWANHIYLCDAEGAHARELARISGGVTDLAWSPDGNVLRFTLNGAGDHQSIWQLDSDGKGLHPLFTDWRESSGQEHGRWTAGGKYFIFQSLNPGRWGLWAAREESSWLGRKMERPILLTEGVMEQTAPDPSPSGQDIFLVGVQARSEVVRYDAPHSRLVPFLGRLSVQQLDYSSDGRWLAYVSYPDGTLWRSRIDGTDQIQLSPASVAARTPRWSPDGKWIAFMGEREDRKGVWQLYLVQSSGGGLRSLANAQMEQGIPTWSPDGKFLVFGDLYRPGVWPASRLQIHLYCLASGKVSTVPGSEGLWTARYSPQGGFIAALTADNRTVMLYDVAAGKWSRLATTSPIADLAWSRSGDALYFVDYYLQRGIFRILLKSHKIEKVTSLAGFRSGPSGWLGVAPDDSPLLIRNASSQEIYSLHCNLP